MSSLVSFERHGRIGVLRLHHPPVNALSPAVVQGMAVAFDAFEADPSLQALLVHCDGRTFVAGGDIGAFDQPGFSAAPINALFARFERSARPVVAALHGTVLGGGLELALACHHRVAAPGTRLGLPEVKLGLLPGSLGTQRLPRLAGVPLALDMMLSGRMLDVASACGAGIVDRVEAGAPLEFGLRACESLVAAGQPPRRTCELDVPSDGLPQDGFEAALAQARRQPAHPQREAIVRCVQAAVQRSFEQGAAMEAEAFARLLQSPTSKALRHLFFAERQTAKVPGLAADAPLREVASVGVLGAGTMGGGIAMNFLDIGVPVVLVDATEVALQRGVGLVRSLYEAGAAKGKLTAAQVEARMALLRPSLDDRDLTPCDLVIEAVFEDLALKQQVCRRLGRLCKPGAIIATNTSTLDVDVLAEASDRAADVVGLHFFSPANVMRLLEVVRGARTAPDVLATALKLSARIGKVPVVSGVCYGFIGNRMAEVYLREAEFLLMEGAEPQQIDRAVQSLGLAMGPCRMLDMAGVDVSAKTVIERGKAGGLPPDPRYRAVVRQLFAIGRHGQKTGAGFYRYEGRTPVPDPEVVRLCEALAREHGIARRSDIGDQEIVERLLYPLVNEGARLLEEGIAYRSGDIDVVWVAGYGFPDHQGGPMWWAEQIGLPVIVDRMAHYAGRHGDAFGYWTPAPLLLRRASGKGRFDGRWA